MRRTLWNGVEMPKEYLSGRDHTRGYVTQPQTSTKAKASRQRRHNNNQPPVMEAETSQL